jgi:hypothetical protein
MGLHDLFHGEGACDDRLQFPLGELIVDPLFRIAKNLRMLGDRE